MDDFVLNVRQIGNYPEGVPEPGDLVLVQQGGLGGSYTSATVADLVFGGLQVVPGVLRLNVRGGLQWGDWGSFLFDPASGWSLNYLREGIAASLFNFDLDGNMQLPYGSVRVARDPIEQFEVATRGFVQLHTVASFNDRTGPVTLGGADLAAAAGGVVATQDWVNGVLCASIPDFIYNNPFVYTFNGRVGDICLTLDDVTNAFFANPGVYPTAPTPPLGDVSKKIATTAFVDASLQDMATSINNSWNAADYELLNIVQTQYAPLASPVFTGTPTTPLPPPTSNDASIPTTSWVMTKIASSTAGVASFNTRTGAVTLSAADVTSAGGALLASPTFSGTPTAPLPPANDNTAKIATTAWVMQEISAISSGVTSWNGRSGIVNLLGSDLTAAGGALLAGPSFTGVPTAPTAAPGTNTTQLATTAFVTAAAAAGVASFNGRTGAVSLQLNDVLAVGGAPLASPTFTGVPAAPTAAPGTSTTQLATTAFVGAAVAPLAPLASPALTGTPTVPTVTPATDSSTKAASTAFVQSAIAASAAPTILLGYLAGMITSPDGTSPLTVIDVTPGICADSAGAVYLKTTVTWKKSTAGAWVAGNGGNGLGTGVAKPVSGWLHFFAIVNGGAVDFYWDSSITAANRPAGTTAWRRIWSNYFDASSNLKAWSQVGKTGLWTVTSLDLNNVGVTTAARQAFTALVPPGIKAEALMRLTLISATAAWSLILTSPDETDQTGTAASGGTDFYNPVAGQGYGYRARVRCNTASQFYARANGGSVNVYGNTYGYTDQLGTDGNP